MPLRRYVFAATVLLAALAASGLRAAPLDPNSFTSLGTMNLAAGSYTVDTTALTLTGPGTNFNGVVSGSICVFCFDSITVQTGATVTCVGTRPVAFLSKGTAIISGTISADGGDAQVGFTGFTPAGGAGGGAGGTAGDPGLAIPNGNGGGPGGGTASSGNSASGGGGIELGAIGAITINSGGILSADGGDGEVANYGASGGGSGGGIYVHSNAALTLAGTIRVRGGGGGKGGC